MGNADSTEYSQKMSNGSQEGRHCYVYGRVQGVFFRAETEAQANRHGLTGWVRNLPDGRVEAAAVGPADRPDALCNWLRRGPAMAHVLKLECEPVPYEEHDSFTVLPTTPFDAGDSG